MTPSVSVCVATHMSFCFSTLSVIAFLALYYFQFSYSFLPLHRCDENITSAYYGALCSPFQAFVNIFHSTISDI